LQRAAQAEKVIDNFPMREYFCRRFQPSSGPTQALPCRRFITVSAFFLGRPAKTVGLSNSSSPTQNRPGERRGATSNKLSQAAPAQATERLNSRIAATPIAACAQVPEQRRAL
jgi:hypothetical protein